MAEVIITLGAFLAKGLAIGVIVASCAAIYLLESRSVAKEA
jgi:hypothetical protein